MHIFDCWQSNSRVRKYYVAFYLYRVYRTEGLQDGGQLCGKSSGMEREGTAAPGKMWEKWFETKVSFRYEAHENNIKGKWNEESEIILSSVQSQSNKSEIQALL